MIAPQFAGYSLDGRGFREKVSIRYRWIRVPWVIIEPLLPFRVEHRRFVGLWPNVPSQTSNNKSAPRIRRNLMPFWRASRATYSQKRQFATHAGSVSGPGQTYIEKIVQKYAVDLPSNRRVRAGDYVMIQPEHVMTHDNTGPVISKRVPHLVCIINPFS